MRPTQLGIFVLCFTLGLACLCYWRFEQILDRNNDDFSIKLVDGNELNDVTSIHIQMMSDDGIGFDKIYIGTKEEIRQELIKDGIDPNEAKRELNEATEPCPEPRKDELIEARHRGQVVW